MPDLRTYSLFISHAWRYGGDYDRIESLLDGAALFHWKNYSCPRSNPAVDPQFIHPRSTLIKELENQIRPTHCTLVLAGIYVSYSDWIQEEIEIAQSMGKPIIGVKPWGQERLPRAVVSAADETVGWSTSSIVSAIRKWAI